MSEGWGFTHGHGGRYNRHYFRDGRSLCLKFFIFGEQMLVPGGDEQTDNCPTCRSRREQERARAEEDLAGRRVEA